MKRTVYLIALLAVILAASPASAQKPILQPRNEIAVSYGLGSNSLVLEVFAEVVMAIAGAHNESAYYVGPVGMEYFHNVSNIVGIGAIATIVATKDNQVKDEAVVGSRTADYYTLMPAVKLNWLRREVVSLYSKAGIGATLAVSGGSDKESSPQVIPNFHVSLVGVEVGRSVRGFLEAGWGEQGKLLAGARYRF